MDKLTALNMTFDRIVLQYIFPGVLALLPYALLLLATNDPLRIWLEGKGSALLVTLISISAFVVGFLLEEVGSRIERWVYDNWNKEEFGDVFKSTWDDYLKLEIDDSHVGQSYLSNIVFRMKIELSLGCSLPVMALGLILYDKSVPFVLGSGGWVVCIVAPFALGIYLLWEGSQSSRLLHETRRLILESKRRELSS